VLGSQIDKRGDGGALVSLNEGCVAFRNVMRVRADREEQSADQDQGEQKDKNSAAHKIPSLERVQLEGKFTTETLCTRKLTRDGSHK